MTRGWPLRLYLLASYGLALLAPLILRKRLARGKETAGSVRAKRGLDLPPRPRGRLIWIHAVGLGEVMSLRGLIDFMAADDPKAHFLVTSSTKASAAVFARNLPPRTTHHFLPIDAPPYRGRFLDHFQPNLCVWAEQDLWPGFVSDLAKRRIPQAVIAARMNAASFRKHQKARGLYANLYQAMALITAQDQRTADHLQMLGGTGEVAVTGSLKPSAPALHCEAAELTAVRQGIGDRFVWAVAPAHPADQTVAVEAHERLCAHQPDALLIIAPRFPDRAQGAYPRRSKGQMPGPADKTWLCDTYGELGLIYRLSKAVLIGGTFSDIEGHNPWEAVNLDNAILHGPHTDNFATDFAMLDAADGALSVADATDIVAALQNTGLQAVARNARTVAENARAQTQTLARQLLDICDDG
ncbi:3-deoxy-D-manno-octulosonic acid transferase [Yoonia sp. SS1-5]|uniref:3-deoxy-D-manno-octulosonic acid transferase n=2 Tax=Yoonia rhodophyticola TaxID=3137370 RepID=A0AAN0MDA8_9RHOB